MQDLQAHGLGDARTVNEFRPAPVEITAEPMVVLKGFVQGPDGNPIAGISIRVLPFADMAYTSDRGEFSYWLSKSVVQSQRTNREQDVMVDIFSWEHRHLLPAREQLPFSAIESGKVLRVRMQEGVKVRGQVLAEDDRGVPGVQVFIDDKGTGSKTDHEGRYETLVAKGKHDLIVTCEDPGWLMLRSHQARTEHEHDSEVLPSPMEFFAEGPNALELPVIKVRRNNTIRVRALHPEGSRLESATAIIKDLRKDYSPFVSTIDGSARHSLDLDGYGEINPIGLISPAATVEVTAVVAGQQYFGSARCAEAKNDLVEVTLSPQWSVSGRVLFNGEPVNGAKLTIHDLQGKQSVNGYVESTGGRQPVSLQSGVDGRFQVNLPPDGQYYVHVNSVPQRPETLSGTGFGLKKIASGQYSTGTFA